MIDLTATDDLQAVLLELQRRDFVSFLIRAFPHISGGADLDPNWHLDAITCQLARVRAGDCRRLLVTLPPRHLKSIMISVAWVAWCLGQDPRLNFVCVSYSSELALKHARDCRSIMQSAWYRELFPRTVISQQRSAIHDFETTRGGCRLATSVGGTLTGRGGDIIIIDDPIKPDDAMSDLVRGSVNEWFYATLASRLNDKKRGAILTVMQRLHQYDLAGMLLESGEWDELSLPAIADEAAEIPLTRGRTYQRRAGEALHEARFSVADLLREKVSIGSHLFAGQYQQRPVPAEGAMVKAAWLKTYDTVPQEGIVVQSWETASKDGVHNDWSVGITARLVRNVLYIIDVWRRKVEIPDLAKAVIEHAREHRSTVLLIEDQASGTYLLQHLWNQSPRGVPTPIACKPDADKKTRLAGVTPMIEAGQMLLPQEASWLAEFKQELLAFPACRHDDQVDALSQLLIWSGKKQRMDDLQPLGGAPILYVDGEEYHGDGQYNDPFGDPW